MDSRVPPAADDPVRWDALLGSVGLDSLLVVIERWMGETLRAHTTAEDILQDTLVHAWQDRERLPWHSPAAARAWLLAIARNRIHDAVDQMQAQKRGGAVHIVPFSALESGTSISQLLPGSTTATPARMAYYRERSKLMEAALAALPADLEPLVRGHLFEQEPMEALAARLGIPPSTAWYRFRKGAEAYAADLEKRLASSA
jgi:RNA polymerase sigma factor (sigma-70 family)